MKRALIDVDGVLADFLTPALGILNRMSDKQHHAEELKDWDLFSLFNPSLANAFFRECNQPGFCASLEPYAGAAEGMREVAKHATIYIVTSPINHGERWTFEREGWLKKHFGIPSSRIVHTSAKYLCRGDVLVDDRPQNVTKWIGEHPKDKGLLWDMTYNQSASVGIRVHGWDEVCTHLTNP